MLTPSYLSSSVFSSPLSSSDLIAGLNKLRKDQGSSQEAPNILCISHVHGASEGREGKRWNKGSQEEVQTRVERRTLRKYRRCKNAKETKWALENPTAGGREVGHQRWSGELAVQLSKEGAAAGCERAGGTSDPSEPQEGWAGRS